MLGPHGGRGGQKRPKNGPHGLCMTPYLDIYYVVINTYVKFLYSSLRTDTNASPPETSLDMSDDKNTSELESDEEMCSYEKIRMRNIAERQKKFEEFKLANLVSEVSAHLKKKKSGTKADDAFECYAKPSTSRSLPNRSCKTNIIYTENDEIENEEPNCDESEKEAKLNEESTKNSTQNEVNDTTKEDEEKEATTKVWNEINEKICEYKVLIAKRRDYMKEQKLEQRYEESEAKSFQRVLKYIDNWSSDRPPEKLLMVVNWQIKSLKGSLPHSYFP